MDAVLYQSLQQEFNKTPTNLPHLGELLKSAMVQLTTSGALVAPPSTLPSQQLVAIRDVLEMGAYWSVHSHDGPSFERYLAQLTSFYSNPMLPVSSRMLILLGLRLLNLLVTGRRSHFYTSLAQLAPHARADPHIQFVAEMEQCLMEGTYHRLLVAKTQVPAPEYGWLVESLIEAVRLEIAEAVERSYETIEVNMAARLLLLSGEQVPQLLEFGGKRGWRREEERIIFPAKSGSKHESQTSPQLLIHRALSYAAELEQIV